MSLRGVRENADDIQKSTVLLISLSLLPPRGFLQYYLQYSIYCIYTCRPYSKAHEPSA